MLRIRLARTGKKNKAQFRVVVAEKTRAASKRFVEILGHYNPHSKEKVFKKERIQYWISQGAQPSATVHNFLVDAGIIKGKKVTSWKPKKKSEEEKQKEAEEMKVKEEAKAKKEAGESEVKKEAVEKEETKKEDENNNSEVKKEDKDKDESEKQPVEKEEDKKETTEVTN